MAVLLSMVRLIGVGLGSFAITTAQPATALDSPAVSADVTLNLGSTTLDDENVGVDGGAGEVGLVSLGALPLPSGTGLTAYHLLANGDQLFSLDTTVELAGPLTVERGDVVRYDGSTYTLEFDASGNGLSSGVITDAASEDAGGDLLLSFDITVALGAFTAGDEDLIECQNPCAGVCSGFGSGPVFDGSSLPGDDVPDGLDLDGANDLGGGVLHLSFDGSGSLGGTDFDDEDVLEYDPSGPTWTLVYDGSAEHAAWGGGADLNALPEPGWLLQLVSAGAFLALLGRKRARR